MWQQHWAGGLAPTHAGWTAHAGKWVSVPISSRCNCRVPRIGTVVRCAGPPPLPRTMSLAASAACSVVAPVSKRIVAVSARPQQPRPQRPASGPSASSSKSQRAGRASLVRVAAMAASTATEKSVSGTMAALKAQGK